MTHKRPSVLHRLLALLAGALIALAGPAMAQSPTYLGGGTVKYPVVAPPTTIAAGQTWTSDCTSADGYSRVGANLALSQAGTLAVQRFIDMGCASAIDTATLNQQTLVAGTPGGVAVANGAVFGSFKVIVTNTGASTATVSAAPNPGWVALGKNSP